MRTFLLRKPMRGKDDRSEILFSYIRLDERIPADHPLRVIRQLVDAALAELSPAFAKLYARDGRPSIPPERLLRALLLQAFYTVRSELQLMEQLNYNLLFRWFVGLSADDPVWDATVFCKNRDRLLNGDIARKFMISVLNLPEVRLLLSSEHFLGRRHSDRGLGQHEKLRAEGRQQATAGEGSRRQWRAQCRTRLPWRETQE
jgi:transposase